MYDLTETKTGNLTTWAADINRHHEQATLRAGEAINHAIEAGKLLLTVKQRLPHGEFGKWVEANIKVTQRQAQRYIAAAEGKPVPVRAIASNTTPVTHLPSPAKTDTVTLFKIRPSEAVELEIGRGDFVDLLQIFPSTHAGFFHYFFTSGKEDGGCSATFSKKPIRADFVPSMVQEEMPDWEFANITRTPHPGRAYNVAGVAPDGTEWLINPPWVKDSEAA